MPEVDMTTLAQLVSQAVAEQVTIALQLREEQRKEEEEESRKKLEQKESLS